jgi:hypothetical protein
MLPLILACPTTRLHLWKFCRYIRSTEILSTTKIKVVTRSRIKRVDGYPIPFMGKASSSYTISYR